MTIDLADLPRVLPVSVPRVNPETGKATKPLIDWEQSYSGVIKGQLSDLQGQVVLAQATADGASASVTTEATARISGDTALAGQITTVSAAVDGATASGAIYFAAKAAPTGASSAYGLYLTAGSAFAGFEVLALSGGGSAINMTANKLSFSDSGTAQNVFSYSSGLFTFNVPVNIRTGDIGTNAVTQIATGTSAGTSASATLTTTGGDVIIIANYDGQDTPTVASAASSNPVMPGYGTMTLTRGATSLVSKTNNTDVFRTYSSISAPGAGGPCSYTSQLQYRQTQTLITIVDSPAAGTYTYTVGNDKTGGLFIMALERKR